MPDRSGRGPLDGGKIIGMTTALIRVKSWEGETDAVKRTVERTEPREQAEYALNPKEYEANTPVDFYRDSQKYNRMLSAPSRIRAKSGNHDKL